MHTLTHSSSHLILLGNFSQWIENNWGSFLASLFVTVVVAVIVYRWQKKEKIPRFLLRSVTLVSNTSKTYPNLSVHYKGHGDDLENLTVAVFVFWNAGRETIRKADIAPADPLMITSKEGVTILGANVLAANNKVNNVLTDYSKSQNRVILTFDFLDCDHGFVVEVLHTGTKESDIQISGTIIGAGPVSKPPDKSKARSRRIPPRVAKRQHKIITAILIVPIMLMGILSVVTLLRHDGKKDRIKCIEVDGQLYADAGNSLPITRDEQGIWMDVPMPTDMYYQIVACFILVPIMVYLRYRNETILPKGLELYEDHLL